MSYLQTKLLTHRQQVLRLYKAAVKNERNFTGDRDEWRFSAVVMRDRFEKNRNVLDLVKAQALLAQGQLEFKEKQHPFPLQFPDSPGGTAYGRDPPIPDFVMDMWHPMEKAQFPDYFTTRAKLKKDYIKWYEAKYGIKKYNPSIEGHPHEAEHDDHDDGHKKSHH